MALLDKLKSLLAPSEINIDGEVYMRRWRFGSPNGYGVRLHQILKSDPGRIFHDHPFTFVSVLLSGSYIEHTPTGSRRYYAGDVLYRPAEVSHRLEVVGDEPVWTLVFRGPYRREWGFIKWTPWRKYHEEREVLKAAGLRPPAHEDAEREIRQATSAEMEELKERLADLAKKLPREARNARQAADARLDAAAKDLDPKPVVTPRNIYPPQ